MNFDCRGLLLDIEGTTSSLSFVYDVMFPAIRRDLSSFLHNHWQDDDVQLACQRIARDAAVGVEQWSGSNPARQREVVEREVLRLMDGDVKATGLKQLQGLIWRHGFESGELQAHVYPEVPGCLARWREAGIDVRVYSSGSIQAQRLFFGHTEAGDLLPLFSGHYDTTVGPKNASASYTKIAADWGLAADQILFVSDVVAELDAASTAGLQAALCQRPGNADVATGHGYVEVFDFEQLRLTAGR